ncbi:MAG: hypothetical protein LUE17_16635 [Planctomycetaceae bacterium]|nr:hypothetical protein [Planctomycetaceae bacterium]
MADAEYPVYRSDANETEDRDPWEKHEKERRQKQENAAAGAAAPTRKPDDSSEKRHQRLEEELNKAGKEHIETAKSVPPELLGSMDNPGMVLND